MITFASKLIVSLSLVAVLWEPAGDWVGAQKRAGLACQSDFSACRVAGTVVPLIDRSSVLGQIAEQARNDPAGHLQVELREVAIAVLDGVRAAARERD
tara:strand:+ start:1957 stop:2250 length:294 start_codon:yes stop_codon:yes gene_type:complete